MSIAIGEKIKYFRSCIGYTQKMLAEEADIHIVSIKKYETGRMKPRQPQIEKLAKALRVSPNALMDFDDIQLRLSTAADLFGILFYLYKADIIFFDGKRDETGKIDPDTIAIRFEQNEVVNRMFGFTISDGKKSVTTNDTKNIKIEITNPKAKEYFANWDHMIRFEYYAIKSLQEGGLDKDHENIAEEILQVAAKFELEMQRYRFDLDRDQFIHHEKSDKQDTPQKK
jgi:transcriptional regulator with XRE-family HTH domain